MKMKYCLVLGSKPNAPLPDITPVHIYSANGAAERAMAYAGRDITHTAVVSSQEYRNKLVHDKIIASRPARILIRSHFVEQYPESDNGISLGCITGDRQFALERHYFGLQLYRIFLMRRGFKKVKAAVRHLQGVDYAFGATTGLWSVLYALSRHPENSVVVAGVGLRPGNHFYNSSGFQDKDARRDYFLASLLDDASRGRIMTTDELFAERAKVALWNGPVL